MFEIILNNINCCAIMYGEKVRKHMKTYTKKNKNYHSKKPLIKKPTAISKMKEKLSIEGTVFCGSHKFACGWSVPIYEINTVHALTQIIGYAKFINRAYGDVYYRGECNLHDGLMPSIFRRCASANSFNSMKMLVDKVVKDDKFIKTLNLDEQDDVSSAYAIEGMLQHYGLKTRYIDMVDNHWVALWMGQNELEVLTQIDKYYRYRKREFKIVEMIDNAISNGKCCCNNMYQYILLIAIPGNLNRINNGIYSSGSFDLINLRQALPSIFLRPHAQHGYVVRRHVAGGDVKSYDLAANVIGVLKIRIDLVSLWLGNGELLSQANLFPAPAFDNGYDILLSRKDLFNNEFSIPKFI